MINNLIGNQGGPGSFHEAVTLACLGSEVAPFIVAYKTFPEMFRAGRDHKLGKIVTAISNNTIEGFGFITEPYAMLMSESAEDFVIVGEAYHKVEHMLLGIKGATEEGILEVHTQDPAMNQCDKNIQTYLPNAERIGRDDTALSAKYVRDQNNPAIAAIASRKAGELYGLDVIRENFQDHSDNITRFLILENRNGHTAHEDDNKSTVRLITGQNPGSLHGVTGAFADQGINLTSIQSANIINSPFHVQFFVEFDAGMLDPRMENVKKALLKQEVQVMVLGSYSSSPIPHSELEV